MLHKEKQQKQQKTQTDFEEERVKAPRFYIRLYIIKVY